MIQGFTLGRVASALDLHAPDPRQDALARAQVVQASVSRGEKALREAIDTDPALSTTPDTIVDALLRQGEGRANLEWERLGSNDTLGPAQQYRILRKEMIAAEREKVLAMRNSGKVDHEVIDTILVQLDVEESMIITADEDEAEISEAHPLLTPAVRQGDCDHLRDAFGSCASPQSHDGCPECNKIGQTPVALRMCTECGYVGCCDSTPGQHATQHFHDSGHPVMRSFEPGEEWRWCFVDQLPG